MGTRTIRLSRSIVGHSESKAVQKVIVQDGYLGMGKEVKAFEAEIAAFLGIQSEFVVCVNSGTAALHLAVQGVTEPNDEVLVQSLTYISSFQAVSAAGAIPVPCDVRPETITIDLEDASRRITSKTKAIMPVHYASNPGNLDAVYEFAGRHCLRVIEDAAHSFGCLYKGHRIGSDYHLKQIFAESLKNSTTMIKPIVCFSFDGIKNITSGEGGAVITEDKRIAQYIKDGRLLGVKKDTEKRYKGERSWELDVTTQGYRYHMSNIMAAVGRVQLARLENEFAPKRKALASLYRESFSRLPGIYLLETDLEQVTPHIQPVRIIEGKRDGLRNYLEGNGIQTGVHYKPNHLLSFYGGGQAKLPVTEMLYEELLSLPLHPGLTEDNIGYVIDKVQEYLHS